MSIKLIRKKQAIKDLIRMKSLICNMINDGMSLKDISDKTFNLRKEATDEEYFIYFAWVRPENGYLEPYISCQKKVEMRFKELFSEKVEGTKIFKYTFHIHRDRVEFLEKLNSTNSIVVT